ncbi:hypothetical protein [Pseudovibrio sp. Tun.PSC04-5.I4]|uniref:hypothetical protein n=1 Tax=Pseudovibrio sp. Tun.PSC04-5.I4 TaxID=1798213 RepID=UPI0008857369|nr:hypothetical protein [Pseudovibrio sp. Tun.PSC04-5.I4]SDR07601.1 hypothetical protein SAMN04515695_2627 [Pseudovibrio sp. Tun.PSC04-5.I4]
MLDEILRRLAEVERRSGNFVRKVKVASYESGKVVVEDGSGFKSAPVTQASISSGEWQIDAPANAGAQGFLFCQDGETENGIFFPCIPSGANPHASAEGGTLRLKGPEGVVVEIAGGKLTVTADKATVNASKVELGGTGGKKVARKGDMVAVGAGSSKGNWPIIEGSSTVFAID